MAEHRAEWLMPIEYELVAEVKAPTHRALVGERLPAHFALIVRRQRYITRPVGLLVRMAGFQSADEGSIPVRATWRVFDRRSEIEDEFAECEPPCQISGLPSSINNQSRVSQCSAGPHKPGPSGATPGPAANNGGRRPVERMKAKDGSSKMNCRLAAVVTGYANSHSDQVEMLLMRG